MFVKIKKEIAEIKRILIKVQDEIEDLKVRISNIEELQPTEDDIIEPPF